jgi:hypothetical protein
MVLRETQGEPLLKAMMGGTYRKMKVILQGSWVVEDGKVGADRTCNEIEGKLQRLRKIATRDGGWTTLHRADDGSLWELSFPQGELQGGGPPRMESFTHSEAVALYGSLET